MYPGVLVCHGAPRGGTFGYIIPLENCSILLFLHWDCPHSHSSYDPSIPSPACGVGIVIIDRFLENVLEFKLYRIVSPALHHIVMICNGHEKCGEERFDRASIWTLSPRTASSGHKKCWLGDFLACSITRLFQSKFYYEVVTFPLTVESLLVPVLMFFSYSRSSAAWPVRVVFIIRYRNFRMEWRQKWGKGHDLFIYFSVHFFPGNVVQCFISKAPLFTALGGNIERRRTRLSLPLIG